MTTVIGVSFKKSAKVYYFDPAGLSIEKGQMVIVETARGLECAQAVTPIKQVEDEEVVQPLKSVTRIATPGDMAQVEQNKKLEEDALEICTKKIEAHGLEMKLVEVEYAFDRSKIVFFFTANGRVDFRELVKDLAAVFKTRIELRQIGVRDEAKMLGGLGPCGRAVCCRAFLDDFQPVSIKMAKEQSLLLNPTKISGLCGRLMCCLKYEQDVYEMAHKRMPRIGKQIITADGEGTVLGVNAVKETVRVRVVLRDGAYDIRDYAFDDVGVPGKMANCTDGGCQGCQGGDGCPRNSVQAPAQEQVEGIKQEARGVTAQGDIQNAPRRAVHSPRPAKGDSALVQQAAGDGKQVQRAPAPRKPRPPRADRPPRPERPDRPERVERADKADKPALQRAGEGSARPPRTPRPAQQRPNQGREARNLSQGMAIRTLPPQPQEKSDK